MVIIMHSYLADVMHVIDTMYDDDMILNVHIELLMDEDKNVASSHARVAPSQLISYIINQRKPSRNYHHIDMHGDDNGNGNGYVSIAHARQLAQRVSGMFSLIDCCSDCTHITMTVGCVLILCNNNSITSRCV
jgi:hypothetical protein